MLKSRLNIDGTDVGFSDVLSMSANYLIADVRNPEKRNASRTQTITIPGTEEVNRLFQFIFEVNLELTTFNPNLKTPATYFVNEVPVFSGDLQVLKVIKKEIAGVWEVNYECFILGTVSDLFVDIGDSLLEDLDLSDLDHTFNDSADKYTPSAWGSRYYYGYIDYGITGGNSGTWTFNDLKPAVFEKEYVDRIFASVGKTYTSTFFNSAYYKRIVIPDVNQGKLQYTQATITNNQFYAGRSTLFAGSAVLGSLLGSNWRYYISGTDIENPVPYNDESTPPFNDPGGIYNNTLYRFTVDKGSYYQVVGKVSLNIRFIPPAGTVDFNCLGIIGLQIQKSVDSGATWGNEGTVNFSLNTNNFVLDSPLTEIVQDNVLLQVSHPSMICNSGDIIRIRLFCATQITANYLDSLNVGITTGTTTLDFEILPGSEFYVNMNPPTVQYNDTVEVNATIPRNIKQLDFLTSIIRSENLYIEQDKNDENNYIIEPRDQGFYTGNYVDWTSKVDIAEPIEIVPMGEVSAKEYIFKFKEDSDVYNKKYKDEYKEEYGNWNFEIYNDFIKEKQEITVVFSGTPMGGNYLNDIVAPVLAKEKSTNVFEPMRCNIRRLYAGGLIDCAAHNFEVTDEFGTTTTYQKTQYPYIGHLDNPNTPTIDLNFGIPYKIYWKLPAQVYTDNNRYNLRYSKYISEITDPNSRVVICNAYLNENDINSLSFRNIAYVRVSYYYVNKVEGYDPQNRGACVIELLKLKEGIEFIPAELVVDEGDLGTDFIAQMPGGDGNGNGVVFGSQVFGRNNNVMGYNSFVVGDNNVIGGQVE